MLVAGSAQFCRCVRVQGNGPRASRLKANYRRNGSHEGCLSGYLPPTATISGKLLHYSWNLVIVELFSSPILFTAGIHFPRVILHNQGYPKVCPDSPNLSNTGDPFCRNIIVIFSFFVFPDQGLNCFDLESSRVFSVRFPELSVFSVRFPELSLFQINELLHFIDFRKKFIKVQNQFCLKP
jgi:hypothetical protein